MSIDLSLVKHVPKEKSITLAIEKKTKEKEKNESLIDLEHKIKGSTKRM